MVAAGCVTPDGNPAFLHLAGSCLCRQLGEGYDLKHFFIWIDCRSRGQVCNANDIFYASAFVLCSLSSNVN